MPMSGHADWIEQEKVKLNWLLSNKIKILCILDEEWEEIEECLTVLNQYPNEIFSDEDMVKHILQTISDRLHYIRVSFQHRQSLQPERIQ
jgi:hypothetical protein